MRASNSDRFLRVVCAIIMVKRGRKQTSAIILPGIDCPIPYWLPSTLTADKTVAYAVGTHSDAFGFSIFMFIRGKIPRYLTLK
jgi:hypothetical protein